MRTICYTILLMIICTSYTYADNHDIDNVLRELDKVIAEKHIYRDRKEQNISNIKAQLHNTADNETRLKLYDRLFDEYLHYQADSALKYANLKSQYIPDNDSTYLYNEMHMQKASAFGVMGMYNEAAEELYKVKRNTLSKDQLIKYYLAMRTHFGWVSENISNMTKKQKYRIKESIYRDSVLAIYRTSPNIDAEIAHAEKYVVENNPEKAIELLGSKNGTNVDMRHLAYTYYTLFTAYEILGNEEEQIYYLAMAAIMDIKAAVREYSALQKLALKVFQQGDMNRGYKYLNSAMEDAVACNARLRFFEVTEFYPAINKAYNIEEKQKQHTITTMLVIVAFLALLLIVAIFYLYYWMKKLANMRRELSKANKELRAINKQLKETGRIKEIYIMRYLDKCVSYLEKLEQYRRSLEKLAMASKIDELYKAIRSEQFLRDERKNFYIEFDKSFLTIFPNFVNDFNNLLKEEERIQLKPGELMSTEIRIFALIRLGVTDAANIAHFLGCSLATVYNYRSKIRNKAKDESANFEQKVMELQ